MAMLDRKRHHPAQLDVPEPALLAAGLKWLARITLLGLVPILGTYHLVLTDIPDPTRGIMATGAVGLFWAFTWWLHDLGALRGLTRIIGLRAAWRWLRQERLLAEAQGLCDDAQLHATNLSQIAHDERQRRRALEKEISALQHEHGTLKLAHRSLKNAHEDATSELRRMARQVSSAKGQVTKLRKAAGLPTGKKPSRKKQNRRAA